MKKEIKVDTVYFKVLGFFGFFFLVIGLLNNSVFQNLGMQSVVEVRSRKK